MNTSAFSSATEPPDDPIAKLHKFVRAALESAGKAVLSAPNGSRNDVLNRETFALAGFVPKYLDRELLREVMLAAILANGGDESKDGQKINDAIEAGSKKPRAIPEKAGKARSSSGARSAEEPRAPGGEGQSATAGVFVVGDQTEMSLGLLATLQGGGPALVQDEGALYRFTPDTKTWDAVDEGEQSRIVQAFSGMPIEDSNKLVKVQATDVSGARKLAGHRVKRDGFFAEGGGRFNMRHARKRSRRDAREPRRVRALDHPQPKIERHRDPSATRLLIDRA
ncbi:MAG: hypothetical protein ACLP1X_12070, partial [Polyangiaceae bacterium]